MRRSAAPSQAQKRTNFSPPFKTTATKKQCSTQIIENNPATSPVAEIWQRQDVKRNAKDILKLLQNSDTVVEGSAQLSDSQVSSSISDESAKMQTTDQSSDREKPNFKYFSVVWCKLSKKKHKKWEGDGVLSVRQRTVVLKDMEGKEIGRGTGYKLHDLETLEEGNTLPIGGKEVEIQGEISQQDYISGQCFQGTTSNATNVTTDVNPTAQKKTKIPFKLPSRVDGQQLSEKENLKCSLGPLYDPSATDSIVLPRPSPQHQWKNNTRGLPIIDVVVDPFVSSHLRPHQQAGVLFLYECLMEFRMQGYEGAILADEMGLGKTLQCIALIWTLLKQGPYGRTPVLTKVLIVTPSSLTANWGKEFFKWLSNEKLRVFIVDQHKKPEDFKRQNISPIMIISYEMLVRSIDAIKSMNFDLLLCDEGHRLKNSSIKTTSLIAGLNIRRRIILTGTPIQNDLQELFALIEFVNPGVLGTSAMFRRVYEEPILRSKQPSASKDEKETGQSRAAELNRIISLFTLRRTQDVINKYLPPKTECVVFCKPSDSQSRFYEAVVRSNVIRRSIYGNDIGADHLSVICLLRKLCNHPALLRSKEGSESRSEMMSDVAKLIPEDVQMGIYSEEDSGKLAVVSCLLYQLAEEGRERIVLVSNFTSTLDMLQKLCERYHYPFLRLDGSTPTAKRQAMVDKFNAKYCPEFVFLLSAKAGGVGLNLIGSSRIVLFDIDWNPATDLQAMARVWRDGQKKRVFIYRLLLAGSIEEKMYQRQVCKQGISGSVVDARRNTENHFSTEELKDLFSFDPDASCLTHDLLNCNCDQLGGILSQQNFNEEENQRECQLSGVCQKPLKKALTMDQLHSWNHYSTNLTSDFGDHLLEIAKDFITFIFKCNVTQEESII